MNLVHSIRAGLGMSQVEFGRILGYGGSTVSRWECESLSPGIHTKAVIEAFRYDPSSRMLEVGQKAKTLLASRGPVAALAFLLNADQLEKLEALEDQALENREEYDT